MIAPWVIKSAMVGPAFAAYVEVVLVPELAPGTAVTLDNLSTHKTAAAAKAMRDAGCRFAFLGKPVHWTLFFSLKRLPPYSPDLNPIEMAFSKLKAHLRHIGARSFTDMFDAIAQVCDLHSTQECLKNQTGTPEGGTLPTKGRIRGVIPHCSFQPIYQIQAITRIWSESQSRS